MRGSLLVLSAALGGAACGRFGFEPAPDAGADGPAVGFVFAASTTDETVGTHAIGIALASPAAADVEVDVAVAGGTATAGADFTITAGHLVIPAGQTAVDVVLAITADGTAEPDETVELALTARGASVGRATHTATISANALPRVQFASPGSTADEGQGTVGVDVVLDTAASGEVVVGLTAAGTATSDDYALTGTMVVIPAGATSAPVPIAVVDDALDEEDETVALHLAPISGAVAASQVDHVHAIVDDDAPPTVGFATAELDIPEAGGPVALQVTLDAPSGKEIKVEVTLGASTLSAADVTWAPAPLTFPPGTTTQTWLVTPLDDALDEGEESAILGLSGATNATVRPSAATMEVSVLDDDPPPSLRWNPSARTVGEGAGTVTLIAELSAASGQPVRFALTGATTNDYTTPTGLFTIPPGALAADVIVAISQDTAVEGTEVFAINLSGVVNATVVAGGGTFGLTIVDDD